MLKPAYFHTFQRSAAPRFLKSELYISGSITRPESLQLVFLVGGYSDSLMTAMEASRIVARITGGDEDAFEGWAKEVNGDFMMAVPTHNLNKDLSIDGEGVEQIRHCGEYEIALTVAMRRSKMTQAYTLKRAA